ncbi:hypothetical protein BVX98_06510 [bacterium F11]|nr:hypothetical protein BVX98_06510 [bacterium F11]
MPYSLKFSFVCHGYVPIMTSLGIYIKPMNELNWIGQIQWQDEAKPLEIPEGQEVYTLYLSDFNRLPDVDYLELIDLDPHIRALLN